jgi:hypothetical protein
MPGARAPRQQPRSGEGTDRSRRQDEAGEVGATVCRRVAGWRVSDDSSTLTGTHENSIMKPMASDAAAGAGRLSTAHATVA